MGVMAKFFLSIIITATTFLPLKAAQNGVTDEFRKLQGVSSKALLDKGYAYVEKCQYDSALIYYSMVANRYYENKNDRKAIKYAINAFQNIGIIYMVSDFDYKKSYDNLLEAMELAEKSEFKGKLPNIYNCIANILQTSRTESDSGEEKQVVEMLKKSFYCSLELKDYESMAVSITNLITIAFSTDSHININKEIRIYRSVKAPNTLNRLYTLLHCQGYDEFRKKNYDCAVDCFIKSIGKVDNKPLSYRGIMSSYNCINDIYEATKQYDKAIETAKKSIETAKKYKSYDYIPGLYRTLMSIYKDKGDSANAQKYEYLYLKEKHKMLNEAQLASVKSVKFMRELNHANEQVRQLSEKRRLQTIIIVAVVIVACIIGVLLYRLTIAYRNIQQANRHLYNTNVELLRREALVKQKRDEMQKKESKVLSQAKTQESNSKEEKNEAKKYQSSRLTENDTKELYERILNTMENSQEIYQQGFNVDKLSELVHSRSRYVSQAINQEYGDNFNQLLNEYRIKEACRRLNGKAGYTNMTIEGIAESVGFKSRTGFGALFKSATGLSPSAYQKMAKESSAE